VPVRFPIEIEAGQTYDLLLAFPGRDMNGSTVRTQFRRTASAPTVDHEFATGATGSGWTVTQLSEAMVLETGMVLPVGTWVAVLRIERSVTAGMTGRYWHATEVEYPSIGHWEPVHEQPIHGPVNVLLETVR